MEEDEWWSGCGLVCIGKPMREKDIQLLRG